MPDLLDLDATAIAALVRSGEVAPADVLEAALARIDERNPVLNAVVTRRDDAARAEVEGSLPVGPLTGVPLVVKDLGATVAGSRSTRGSRLFADVVASTDSELVRRYKAAGAMIVGLTNTPELGRNGSTEPALFGPARNPHRLTHSTGGSSGGTAAAVAAGIVPAGHANDGGGSIRIPASMCGLIGLKPSRGRVTAAPARNLLAYPLGINHALTRTVRDSALLLDVVEGPMLGDPIQIARPVRAYVHEVGADPGRCRVALSVVTPAGDGVDAACAAAARRAAQLLDALGHRVSEATPDYDLANVANALGVFLAAPLVLDVDERLAELGRPLRDDDLEPLTHTIYERGRAMPGTAIIAAHQSLESAAQRIGAFFGDYDLLVTPTIARTVPPLGLLNTFDLDAMKEHGSRVSALTGPFNVTGQPALSLPIGTDDDGLPVGVQLVAAFGREDLLLRIASQLEAAGAWQSSPVWPPR